VAQVRRTLTLTYVVLIVVVVAGVYQFHQTGRIDEWLADIRARRTVNPPPDAEFMGVREFNISNSEYSVYAWRYNDTLYEVILDADYMIVDSTVYMLGEEEVNSTITPMLAEMISVPLLVGKTDFYPGHPMLSNVSVFFEPMIGSRSGMWRVGWGLHVSNYTIHGAYFAVRVNAETGRGRVYINAFNVTQDISVPEPPRITGEEALESAKEAMLGSLEYPVITSAKIREIGLTSPGFDLWVSYELVWVVYVNAIGVENGNMVWVSTVYFVDAYTGETSYGLTVGGGIGWKEGRYPYYGSAYPTIIEAYPHDYVYPASMDEVWDHIYNNTIDTVPGGMAIEKIVLTAPEYTNPRIIVYWTRGFNGYKAGAIRLPDLTRYPDGYEYTPDGFIMVIDPYTDTIVSTEHIAEMQTPETLELVISRDEAIQIVKNSTRTDPKGNIVLDEAFELAEPRVIAPHWIEQLKDLGDYDYLYITRENITEPQLYWIIKYSSDTHIHGGRTGLYLVDAETGEIVFIVEDHPLPFLLFRASQPEDVTVNRGGSVTLNITVTANPSLDAVIPITLAPNITPENVSIDIPVTVKPISNTSPAWFTVTIHASENAETGEQPVSIGVRGPSSGTSAYFTLKIQP